MFKKLLLKALKSLKPEEKEMFRKALAETPTEETAEQVEEIVEKSESTENVSEDRENNEEKGEQIMSNENEKTEEKVEDVEKTTEKAENNEVDKENSTEKVEETKEDVEKTETEEKSTEENPTAPQVQETETSGNGVRIEDLVTKEELMEKLAAMEAKFDAVVKENQDLKDKYENKDFGNFARQGVMEKNADANNQFKETFDEYSKKFM